MKKYPFSMARNAHHLDCAYNYLFAKCIYPDNVNPAVKAWAQDRRDKIANLLSKYQHNGIVHLTGKEIAFAKAVVAWAEDFRDARSHMSMAEINADN